MVCHSSSGEGVGCVAVAVSSLGAGCLCRLVCLWVWLPWSVPSTPCQSVSLCRGVCVDGLPVVAGMCCLWLWIGCRGLCRSVGWSATVPAVRVSDGEPVGLVAVVSTLDTLPAVRVCRGLCRSDGGRSMCGLCLLIGGLWSVPSTLCQPVRVWDGLPVPVGCLWSVLSTPCQW